MANKPSMIFMKPYFSGGGGVRWGGRLTSHNLRFIVMSFRLNKLPCFSQNSDWRRLEVPSPFFRHQPPPPGRVAVVFKIRMYITSQQTKRALPWVPLDWKLNYVSYTSFCGYKCKWYKSVEILELLTRALNFANLAALAFEYFLSFLAAKLPGRFWHLHTCGDAEGLDLFLCAKFLERSKVTMIIGAHADKAAFLPGV